MPGRLMPHPEGKHDLTGLARSIDALFSTSDTVEQERAEVDEAASDDAHEDATPPPDAGATSSAPSLAKPADSDAPATSKSSATVPEPSPSEPPSTGEESGRVTEGSVSAATGSGSDDETDETGQTDERASATPAKPRRDAEDSPLAVAVRRYLDGDRALADEVRRLSEEALAERRLDVVAHAVGRLAAGAGAPPDDETMKLAEGMSSPLVLERLAAQMASEPDEPRRSSYYVACRNLGRPMGEAIRDELGESSDPLARQICCEALVKMGPVGREIVEEMIDHENRFLARHAVAILGDTGGGRAVELVTLSLANPDARVRKEALRSLAKLDAEGADELVFGLLDDSDRGVRLRAAVTASELGVERAVRPVIRMLDESKDPDDSILLMGALGRLGDPGAVPTLEKHATRGLFSRPRTDVRIAAYRALHQIGTPHARSLLEAASDDKDPVVKAAVDELVAGDASTRGERTDGGPDRSEAEGPGPGERPEAGGPEDEETSDAGGPDHGEPAVGGGSPRGGGTAQHD